MPSTPPYPAPPKNSNTVFLTLDPAVVYAPRLRRVLESVLGQHYGQLAAASPVPGFLLVAVRGDSALTRLAPALRDHHLVIGRHTECDVVLAGDGSVSLRHLLVRTIVLDDGTFALRLLDLETSLGFGIEDGARVRSIVATGPFAVAIGSWTLCGIPTGKTRGLGGFEGMGHDDVPVGGGPYREVIAPLVHHSRRVPPRVVGDARRSHITLLPGVRYAGIDDDYHDDPIVRLLVRRAGLEVGVPLSAEQLERGVLIGRAQKCLEGVRHILTESVSRAHALILRSDGEDRLYDLASTQRTYVSGSRVRTFVLPRQGARVVLGQREPVELIWSPRFDA